MPYHFTIKDHYKNIERHYRVAFPLEIAVLKAEPGAPHVMFACTSCGQTYWTAKNLALGSQGNYTGARNIFYLGAEPECTCSSQYLACIVPDTEADQQPASPDETP